MDETFEWMDQIQETESLTGLWIQALVILGVTLVISYLAGRLLSGLEKKLQKNTTWWDQRLIRALHRPLQLLIWLGGIFFALNVILHLLPLAIVKMLPVVQSLSMIATIVWFFTRIIRELERYYINAKRTRGEPVDLTSVNAITKLCLVIIIILGGLFALQSVGFSLSGVLAFGGVGGIVVGMAAKDLLSNFFGGMMIYFDRPFAVGEYIKSPDRDIEGSIEQIGWRTTIIRTADKRLLFVPNSAFSTIAVQNVSRMTHRRINEYFALRRSDLPRMPKILDEIEAMLRAHQDVDKTSDIIVKFERFSASSVDFLVTVFTQSTSLIAFKNFQQDILFSIAEIIHRNGAKIALPATYNINEDLYQDPEFLESWRGRHSITQTKKAPAKTPAPRRAKKR